MADFSYKQTPTYGACTTCGSSACPDGFVDLIAETNIVREGYGIVGNIDVVLCADCLTQAARVIGCIPAKEALDLRELNTTLSDQNSRALDDIHSWQQRYENLVEIMSMLQLSNANPDANTEFVPASKPSPDLRVQESGAESSQSNGAVAKRRKNARG